MTINPILSALLRGPWLINPTTAEGLMPLVDRFMAGESLAFEDEKPSSFFSAFSFSEGKANRFESFDDAPEGSVAVINLSGVMMRQDSCFYHGTETISAVTKAAFSHPNIAAVVKVVASGGGSVDGTEVYAQTLATAPKPVVTFVKGMMASAAYWVGSKAQHIMLEGRTTMVGSIGTQSTLRVSTNADTKTHIIRATESTDKNEAEQQALAGNFGPIRTQVLDPLNSVFLQEVKAAREGKLDMEKNPLTGKVYVGQEAIDIGLADSFGTIEDAINLALQLAADSKNNSTLKINQNTMFGKNKFAAIGALAGLAAVTAEQVAAANDELEEKGITAAALISAEEYNALKAKADQVDSLTAANTSLTAAKDAAEAKVSDLEAKVKEYGSQPGTMPTTPSSKGNELSEEISAIQKEIDELPHNKALDNNPLFN